MPWPASWDGGHDPDVTPGPGRRESTAPSAAIAYWDSNPTLWRQAARKLEQTYVTNGSPQGADRLATAGWAVVTRTGIVQARCGHPLSDKPPGPCRAWRLSRPGMRGWRPCFACGSDRVPVPVEVASAEVAAAVAKAMEGRG